MRGTIVYECPGENWSRTRPRGRVGHFAKILYPWLILCRTKSIFNYADKLHFSESPPMKLLPAILLALATAFFWGTYGPALGNARTAVKIAEGGWSPFKPYMFIGVAYLVWGVVGGLVMMKVNGDSFSFTGNHFQAAKWGFLAGSLGAFGALTLTGAVMAAAVHLKGGAPNLVMPFVFGGAVIISAVTPMIIGKLTNEPLNVPPILWLGVLLIVSGAVIVARNAPHPKPKPAASSTPAAGMTAETPAH